MGRQPQRRPPPQQGQQRQQGQPLPVQPHFVILDNLPKMNTKPMRQNLTETEAAWIENLQPVAGNDLVCVPAPLGALTTVPGKIVSRQFSAAILSSPDDPGGPLTDYIIFFATDGSATAINAATGDQVTFAPPGTYSTVPDMTTWSDERILIVDDTTAGYSTWDGRTLVVQGGVSPNFTITNGGSGLPDGTVPVFISGGNGGGATAHGIISGGSLVQVVLDNPGQGFFAGDQIVVTGPPGATITGNVWPQGLQGNTIAVYGGRVWTAKRRTINYTGTGGYDDVSPANAAGFFEITDADLVHEITALRSLNNYLYIFGDQSVKQIGALAIQQPPQGTTGNPTTLFQILTLASDIGCPFPMSILSYNRLVAFCNKHGVYLIYGSSIQKISDDLDGLFMKVDFAVEPSAAVFDLNNLHCYGLLLQYLDSDNIAVFGDASEALPPLPQDHPLRVSSLVTPMRTAPLERALICVLQTKSWWVASQGMDLRSIVSVPMSATNELEIFGSSGSDVTWLLADPDSDVTYILKTPLTAHDNIVTAKQLVRAGVAMSASLPQSINMLAETENHQRQVALEAAKGIIWRGNDGQIIRWKNDTNQYVWFIGAPGFKLPHTSVEGYGRVVGATLFATSRQLSFNAVLLEYIDADVWGIVDDPQELEGVIQ